MKKKFQRLLFRRIGSIAYTLALLLLPFHSGAMPSHSPQKSLPQQQSFVIKGKVVDSKNVPLPGVTVRLDGTSSGTATDMDGSFTLRLPENSGTLVFSFVGFKTVKAPFSNDKPLLVRMDENVSELDEVQVVAYGSQNKREMVGAMSVVKSSDIQDIPSPSVANLLQGKVAGMNVTNITGAPGGGGTSITIRGFNSLSVEASRRFSDPLWVIDGVPMLSFTSPITGTNTLAEIDPNDIETISVLKDAASASIYGSRAANGVILVTTKQGRFNQRPKISASVAHTITFSPNLPELTGGNAERRHRMEALQNYRNAIYDKDEDRYRYMDSYLDSYLNGTDYNYFWNKGEGADVPILQDSLNKFYNNSTNLFDYYFRTTHATDANLQISGGADRIAYNVGLGYYTEKGVLINTGFKRLKLLSNLYMKPIDKLEANLRIYLAYTNRDRSGKANGIYGAQEDAYLEKIPSELLNTSTLLPGEGTPAFDEVTKRFGGVKEKNDSYRVRASFDLAYEFITGLKLKSSVAVDFAQQNQNQFIPSDLDQFKESYSAGQIGRNMTLMNENLLTYKYSFNESHNLDALLGLSVQADENNSLQGFGKRAPSDLIHYVSWAENVYDVEAGRALKDFLSGIERSTMVGVFGRINYNYRQKYLASVTLRRDASSKFGEDVRWGTFPSYAVGYAFSEESFMGWSKKWLDYGKIRLSYGKSGRQFDQPYISYGVLTPGNAFLGNPTVMPELGDGLINRELTWEETKQFDAGVDLDFLQHRIGITLDYYNRYTDKLLYRVGLPGNHSGYREQWQNAYGILNEGVEFQIKGDIIRKENLNWNVTFNIAKNWNMLKKSNNKRDFQTQSSMNNLNVIGKPLNSIYVFKDAGYYQSSGEVPYIYENGKKIPLRGSYGNLFYQPGDRVFTDVDGNGRILTQYPLGDDRVCAGSPLPTIQGGIVSSLSWKGFDVNMSFIYTFGRHILNMGRGASIGTTSGLTANDVARPIFADLSEISFWQQPGDVTDYPANRLENGLQNFATNLYSNVEKVNYLKFKTLTIGYTLPEYLKQKLGVGARVFVSAENLFTITNYSGSDPETVDLVTGIDDLANYPLATRLTVGLTLNF